MSAKPSKLSRFWQELKRRRVVHVTMVYASAAFVIIELVGNLAEPLNLPPGVATILIIVLATGFPLAVILSWYYDLTGQGIERTIPLSEIKEEEKPKVPNAWKIATYVSFVVIIGLVTFNIVSSTKKLGSGDIPSILILPIGNFTGNDQYDEFISGMHSALIGDVQRISGLIVKSKTTSDAYKDSDKSVSQIAAEQRLDAIVQPTIMCLGDSACFQFKVTTSEGEQLWIANYREPMSQLFNLNNQITKDLAKEVHVKLTDDEERILAESRTADPDALEAYIRGLIYWDILNPADLERAGDYFEKAIGIDPDWAPPYAGLSRVWSTLRFFGVVPDSIAHPKIYGNLNKALELEPNSAISYYSIALTATWTEWDWEKGEEAFKRSLELKPNDSRCRLYYAHLLMMLRRSDEAVIQAKLGLELGSLDPLILGLYGVVMNNEGDYESAIAHLEKALSIKPNFGFAIGPLETAYLGAGDYERWIEFWKKIVCYDDKVIKEVEETLSEHGFVAAIEELFRLDEIYGKPGCQLTILEKMFLYRQLNDFEKVLDIYEQLYELSFTNLPYFATNLYKYDQLKVYPRYVEILRKMNLPLPEE